MFIYILSEDSVESDLLMLSCIKVLIWRLDDLEAGNSNPSRDNVIVVCQNGCERSVGRYNATMPSVILM